jgi:hypothetical protein
MAKQPAQRDVRQAADVVRKVLAEVDAGNLAADDTPHGRRLLRRLEGAAAVLEVAAGTAAQRPAESRTAP